MERKQSLIVYFNGWIDSLEPVHRLSEELREQLAESNNGMFDGHEIAMDGSHGSLFFYGTDIRSLFEEVKSILRSSSLLKCTQGVIRLNKDGETEEIIVDL